MKFENTEVFNFEGALRGMRNPLNSWAKSDSKVIYDNGIEKYYIGEKDMILAQNLIKGGSEHCKFLRQIFVSVDITAPMYWWSEFDTYKVGTVANSTSKMHKLASTEIDISCFECDDYNSDIIESVDSGTGNTFVYEIITALETLRLKFTETKDKRYWKELVRWLPESWLQTRTVTMSYANLRAIVHQRQNHKLNEWSGKDNASKFNFISWIETLPYAKELVFFENN